jgi:hypothetical protein
VKITFLIVILVAASIIVFSKKAMCDEFRITKNDGTEQDCIFLNLYKESITCRNNRVKVSFPKSDIKKITIIKNDENFEFDIAKTDYEKLRNTVNQLSISKEELPGKMVEEKEKKITEKKYNDLKLRDSCRITCEDNCNHSAMRRSSGFSRNYYYLTHWNYCFSTCCDKCMLEKQVDHPSGHQLSAPSIEL